MERSAPDGERSGPTARIQTPGLAARTGGLEYEILGTTRWEVAQGLKKRTYSRTKTVIQNPDLGVRTGGAGTRESFFWAVGGKKRALCGKKRTYSQTETRIQAPGLGARTGVWNIEKVESCAPKVGRSGPTAENTRNLHPRSRREKGGVERE